MQRVSAIDRGLLKATIWIFSALLVASLSPATLAQDLPKTNAEDVGLSSERLSRLSETLQRDVDAGEIPGAVVLVARNGKIAYEKAFGYQNREDKIPMKPDAIFRIASMSKPITSVAAMMLAEEGKIDLAAPVAQYLPEFKDTKAASEAEPTPGQFPRPMTVQDLLRHTSGVDIPLGYAECVYQTSVCGCQSR